MWLTEFGCVGFSNASEQVRITFFNDSVALLENNPQVERYARRPWNTSHHLYLPNEMDGSQRRAPGDAFLSAPAYRK